MTTEPTELDLESIRRNAASWSVSHPHLVKFSGDAFALCDEVERLRAKIAAAKAELEAAYTLPWLEGGREWPIENRVKAALEALQ